MGGVQSSINSGIMIDGVWNDGKDVNSIFEFLSDLNGSMDERTMAANMLKEASNDGNLSVFLNSRGEVVDRDSTGIVINPKASLGNVLAMLWEDYGINGLEALGIEGQEAEEIWKSQNDKPKAFGEFIKNLILKERQQEKICFHTNLVSSMVLVDLSMIWLFTDC